ATPSPGSIFAEMAMAPKGGLIPVLLGIVVGAVISFLIASVIVRRDKSDIGDESLNEAKKMVKVMKAESKGQKVANVQMPKLIVFACDAGMGSSAMGESILKKKMKEAGFQVDVKHSAVNQIPNNADVVFTQESLAERASQVAPNARIIAIKNFLDNAVYDEYVKNLKN
ncbi:MAG TPA: PTS mannitol transporter subunit IIBC, partial [Clostridiaceae bacterium]|nr:PTS mannitol transporter subunit IIBC [Clostridiaceae bacterium]